MSEWQRVAEYVQDALMELDLILSDNRQDTQARLWRDHLAEDYKSLSIHAQKTQEVG